MRIPCSMYEVGNKYANNMSFPDYCWYYCSIYIYRERESEEDIGKTHECVSHATNTQKKKKRVLKIIKA